MHTWVFCKDDDDTKRLHEQMKRRVVFLRRTFLENAASDQKIFVYKDRNSVDVSSMIELHDRLRELGYVRLLIVQREQPGHPAGSIEILRDGLARGFLAGFGHPEENDNVWNIDFQAWKALCELAVSADYLGKHAADVVE